MELNNMDADRKTAADAVAEEAAVSNAEDIKAGEAAEAIYHIIKSEQHKSNRAEGAVERLFFGKR